MELESPLSLILANGIDVMAAILNLSSNLLLGFFVTKKI